MTSALLLVALLSGAAPEQAGAAVPADPGVLWDPGDSLRAGDAQSIREAAERASQACGRRILVVANPPGDSSEDAVRALERAWPDRVILVFSWRSWDVRLHTPDGISPDVPPEIARRMVGEVHGALTSPTTARTVVRVVGELGETLRGRPPQPWHAWQHPYLTIAGGQDAEPLPPLANAGITLVALLLLAWFVRALVQNPKAVLFGLGLNLLEAVIGGAVESVGGGSGSGGGLSGGGGSFGGGGASGSW